MKTFEITIRFLSGSLENLSFSYRYRAPACGLQIGQILRGNGSGTREVTGIAEIQTAESAALRTARA